jgi:DNA-binding MarR family transcriptional regulator
MSNEVPSTYELIVLLGMSFRVIIDKLHKDLAQAGYEDVRPVHGFVFQLLSQGGSTGNEIAEHLSITKQAASQIIDHLEESGYVTRQTHHKDSRAKWVQLTEKGWDCIRKTEDIFREVEAQISGLLGEERMGQLRLDLRKLIYQVHDDQTPLVFRPVW